MTKIYIDLDGGELDVGVESGGSGSVVAAAGILVCAAMKRLESARGELDELHVECGDGTAALSAGASGDAVPIVRECGELLKCGFTLLANAFPDEIAVAGGCQ